MATIASLTLQVIGGASIAVTGYKFVRLLAFHYLPFGNSLSKYARKPEAWALITGSSAGIGYGFASDLIKRGFGVVIVAHIRDEVLAAEKSLKAEHPSAQIKTIVMDASTATPESIAEAMQIIEGLPLTILINNVATAGRGQVAPFIAFPESTPANIDTVLDVNCRFSAYVTAQLLPLLRQNAPSLVIGLASGADSGMPYLATYCASKAWMNTFSNSLAMESIACKWGVDFIALRPGDIRSQGNRYGVSPGALSSQPFAKMALDRVGRAVNWGYRWWAACLTHDLQIGSLATLPQSMIDRGMLEDVTRRIGAWDKEQKTL